MQIIYKSSNYTPAALFENKTQENLNTLMISQNEIQQFSQLTNSVNWLPKHTRYKSRGLRSCGTVVL